MRNWIIIIITLISAAHSQRFQAPHYQPGIHQWDTQEFQFNGLLQAPQFNISQQFRWGAPNGTYLINTCQHCESIQLTLSRLDAPHLVKKLSLNLQDIHNDLKSSHFLKGLPLRLERGKYYQLDIEGAGVPKAHFYINQPSEFRQFEHRKLKHYLWYFAILFVFIWVNLILAFTTQQANAQKYIGFLSSFSLSGLISSGVLQYLTGIQFDTWVGFSDALLIVSLIFLIRFVKGFIDRSLLLNVLLYWTRLLYILCLVHLLHLNFFFPQFFNAFILFTLVVVLVVVANQSFHNHHFDLNFIIIALSFFILPIMIRSLHELHLIPEARDSNHYLIFITGHLIEVFIMTTFLAFRAHKDKMVNLRIVEEQERFRRELMVNIAHELRTPLVGMSGVAEDNQDEERLSQIDLLTQTIQQIDPRHQGGDQ